MRLSEVRRKTKKLVRLLPYRSYRRGLRYGVGAAIEHDLFLATHRFATIVDGGANRGQFSLTARRHHPKASIVAFEPIPECAATYRRLFLRDRRVTLIQAALGARTDEVDMRVSDRLDVSSLLPIDDQPVRVERVRLVRLADIISRADIMAPSLLKLDIQGYELEALRGADAIIDVFDHLYLELTLYPTYVKQGQVSPSEVMDWLKPRGFELAGVYDIYYDPVSKRSSAIDAHFERRHRG